MRLSTAQTIDDIDVMFFVSTIQPSVFSKITLHEITPGGADKVFLQATMDLDHTGDHVVIFKSDVFTSYKNGDGDQWLDLNVNRTLDQTVDLPGSTGGKYQIHDFSDQSWADFLKSGCWLPF